MIIMNMQNKLYTIQFSHHPMTDFQSVSKKQSWNLQIMDFAKFPKEVQMPGRERIPVSGNKKER